MIGLAVRMSCASRFAGPRFFRNGKSKVFHWFYKVFHSRRPPKIGSMLDLVLGGVLEVSWSDLGRVLGGQDAPKMAQDGAKTVQDGAKMAQDGAKTAQDGAKMAHDGAKIAQDGAKMVQDGAETCKGGAKTDQDAAETGQDGAKRPSLAKTAQDGAKTWQDCAKTSQDDAKKGHDGAKTVNMGSTWIIGRLETVPRCANREVRWFQIGRASAASEASGALRRFCGPPSLQTAYAKASSIHMFPNASDTHPKTLRSIPNGHLLNALPVPCSLQFFFLILAGVL